LGSTHGLTLSRGVRSMTPTSGSRETLGELYAYYARTEPMFSNVLRDAELVEAIAPTLIPLQDYQAEAAEILAVGRSARGRGRHVLFAALRHALDFQTWRSLTSDGRITRGKAVALVSALVEAAAASRRRAAA
jgi:hypothetical protein